MHRILEFALLIAQDSRVDEMARRMAEGFSDEPVRFGGDLWWAAVLIVGGLMGAAAILARKSDRRKRRATLDNPRRLFADLSQKHGLGWADRRLLRRLARSEGLQEPASLFLEPERFDAAVLDPRLKTWHARFQAIRGRLFAGLGEAASASPPDEKGLRTILPGEPRAATSATPPKNSSDPFPVAAPVNPPR
jgi:hypothetical protein